MNTRNMTRTIAFGDKPVIVRLADGTLLAFFFRSLDGVDANTARYSGYRVTLRTSHDHGQTWGENQLILTLPTDQGGFFRQDGLEAVVDDEGEVHLFFLNDAKTGVVPTLEKYVAVPGEGERPTAGSMAEQRLDIWHTRSTGGRTEWPRPRAVWKGFSGALNSVALLPSGRIVLPFSYLTKRNWENRGGGSAEFTFRGQFDTTVIYSDDRGATWLQSPAALTVPVPDIVSAYGAVEPVIELLKDGRVWMLIRTQNGRFYESFSHDGAAWTRPVPTQILSSDSPPALTSLNDGRIVMFWNNCLRFPYAFGGRHVIHGAISDDDGRTWSGYREAARDETRHLPPPTAGDHGVGYPFAVTTARDRVILITGQGGSRGACVMFEPEWFYEKEQSEDFTNGLEGWSAFGVRGVDLVPHPDRGGARVLAIRKTDQDWFAAAVWNFPASHRGRLSMRLFMRKGCGGLDVGLTDHFSVPFDEEAGVYNLFHLSLGSDPRLQQGAAAPSEKWFDLELTWDDDKGECSVAIDGRAAAALRQTRLSHGGVSYLRLSSPATAPDPGVMVERVRVTALGCP